MTGQWGAARKAAAAAWEAVRRALLDRVLDVAAMAGAVAGQKEGVPSLVLDAVHKGDVVNRVQIVEPQPACTAIGGRWDRPAQRL